jgi:ADP-heptose:LPS heptosyltransferase
MADAPRRVLVIRLGALGDIVQSFGPFAAVRAHHPDAEITLLTTAPYADWLRGAPWFDRVLVDARPRWFDVAGLRHLASQLRGYDMVYDLQTSGRSTRYFWLAGRPPWSGIGWHRRYKHRDPGRDHLHSWERQRGQLRDAGIDAVPAVGRAALAGLIAPPPSRPEGRYAVLIPGAAAHRPEKCWPAAQYGELARLLIARGLGVVVAGADADAARSAAIVALAPGSRDLTGQTSLASLAGLLDGAAVAIGNDTGPMHLSAALGRRCLVLFGGASDPALTAPREPDGGPVRVLRERKLADLTVARVAAALP